MDGLYKAFERTTALIIASEKWAAGYNDAPEEHGKLIKSTARLERKLLLFFKDEAARAPQWINWSAYLTAVQEIRGSRVDAYDVNVIVSDGAANDNSEFISIVFDEIAYGTALGAQAAEVTYGAQLGLSAADGAIQRQTRKQVSQLVGKRVLDDGSVVDNPNAEYVISNTTRKKVQESIHTSIMLGEDVQSAALRMQKIIKDPARAALIARQEMAMAYTSGVHYYGQASGAIGKEWQTNGATDICEVNAKAGPIRFNELYPSGHQHPTAHIGCRCYERLIYQNELDQNPKLFGKTPQSPPANKTLVTKQPTKQPIVSKPTSPVAPSATPTDTVLAKQEVQKKLHELAQRTVETSAQRTVYKNQLRKIRNDVIPQLSSSEQSLANKSFMSTWNQDSNQNMRRMEKAIDKALAGEEDVMTAEYKFTQAYYQKAGIQKVTLYRGISGKQGKQMLDAIANKEDFSLVADSAASWTDDVNMAHWFAAQHKNGVILQQEFDVEQIATSYRTNPVLTAGNENEYIITTQKEQGYIKGKRALANVSIKKDRSDKTLMVTKL